MKTKREQCTPGPWTVRTHTDKDTGEVLDCFITAPSVHGYTFGADLLNDDEYREETGMERKLADAHLMAAAQDMYDTLKELADKVDSCIDEGPHYVRGAITRARAALAKAEGKEQE